MQRDIAPKLLRQAFMVAARVAIVLSLLWLIIGKPERCPAADSHVRNLFDAQTVYDLSKTKLEVDALVNSLFFTTEANNIGVFLLNNDARYLINVVYKREDLTTITDTNIFPILSNDQRALFLGTKESGCTSKLVDELEESTWKRSLTDLNINSGVVCSLYTGSRDTGNLKGVITFEYTGDTSYEDISAEFVINSIEFYRVEISKILLRRTSRKQFVFRL